ncbi:MAG: hypothetical protein IPP37_10475 [Saprospiraceae bacterium]|nr:hypothetical protein [Saprospiraceae bacterium]
MKKTAGFFPASILLVDLQPLIPLSIITEMDQCGELDPGCLDVIISFPASGSYKPTGGAASILCRFWVIFCLGVLCHG